MRGCGILSTRRLDRHKIEMRRSTTRSSHFRFSKSLTSLSSESSLDLTTWRTKVVNGQTTTHGDPDYISSNGINALNNSMIARASKLFTEAEDQRTEKYKSTPRFIEITSDVIFPESEDKKQIFTFANMLMFQDIIPVQEQAQVRNLLISNLFSMNFTFETEGPIHYNACILLDLLYQYFVELDLIDGSSITTADMDKVLKFCTNLLQNTWLWEDEHLTDQPRRKIIGHETLDKVKLFEVITKICSLPEAKLHIAHYPGFTSAIQHVLFTLEFEKYSDYLFPGLVNLTENLEVAEYLCKKHKTLPLMFVYKLNLWTQDAVENLLKFRDSAQILCNMSKSYHGRNALLDGFKLAHLFCFLKSGHYIAFRKCIAETINNCLQDSAYHLKLVKRTEIISALISPLVGFEAEQLLLNDAVPLLSDLETKKKPSTDIEQNKEVRLMLLLGLEKLTQTKEVCEYMQGKNALLILRQYHTWENDPDFVNILQRVIRRMLISDFEEESEVPALDSLMNDLNDS